MKISIKKAFDKKRLIAVAVAFVLIVVMIVSNPEVRDFFSSADGIRLSLSIGAKYDVEPYGNEMLLANHEGIFAIDKNGREAWSIVSQAASPELLVKGSYFMLADINGKTVKTYKKEKLISQIETENEILSAKLNKNGYVAIATDELGYKGLVVLYDTNGKEKFKWHSGAGYIGDIDVSDNGRLAVAQLTTDKDRVYSRIIMINPNLKTEPECIAELDGIVMKLLYHDNGSLIAVSNNGIFVYSRAGKQKYAIDFMGRSPILCNVENENNIVLTFDSGLNGTIIESYSSNGKLRGSYDAGSEVLTVDVNGECIAMATREGIETISPKGKVKCRIKASNDVKAVKIFSGRARLLSLGGNSAEIMKIK